MFDFGRCAAPCVDHDDDEIDGFSFGYATCAVDMFAVCVFPFDSFSLTFVIAAAAAAGGSLDRRHPFLGECMYMCVCLVWEARMGRCGEKRVWCEQERNGASIVRLVRALVAKHNRELLSFSNDD